MYYLEESEFFSNRQFQYTMSDYLADHVQVYVERARFTGSYAKDPDRLEILLEAGIFDDGPLELDDWTQLAERYPKPALIADKLNKFHNEDIPVRAYYLIKAVASLLKVASAPDAMVADLTLLLSSFAPTGARKYSDAQRALIENPEVGVTIISEISGLDRSTIHSLLKKGILVRPDRGVG